MMPYELDFMRPDRLWFLLIIPALLIIYIVWSVLKQNRSGKGSLDLQKLLPKRSAWKRHISVVAAIATLASLVLAWAMPNGYVDVPRDRATVFLVIDVSYSMEATDVAPSRLEAAQEAGVKFVDEIPQGFNVALVSFAGVARLVVAPTNDRGAVDEQIENLELAPSTAMGEGIYSALDGVSLIPPDPDHPDDPAPAVIVLLSDGASQTGRSSAGAAQKSEDMGIPIFTIAYGTDNGYILDDHGNRNPVPVDKDELRNIAKISGGTAYTASSLDKLNEVYSGISRSIGYVQEKQEVTEKFVGGALSFAVIALLDVMSLAARWP